MSASALLLWMSAREAGSWQQFRAAIERLHFDQSAQPDSPEYQGGPRDFPLQQQLRFNLERLGHAEFAVSGSTIRWRVAPPVLAISEQGQGWWGVVTGARSAQLLHRLAASPLAVPPEHHPACPDVISLRSDNPHSLVSLAASAGMLVQQDAPAAILACLAPVDTKIQVPGDIPIGNNWTIERFCTTGLKWLPSTRLEVTSAAGHVFRFESQHLKHVLFCSGGAAWGVSPAVGKYLALRRARRSVLRYDRQRGRLSIPSGCRPPALIERALALCSGRPPLYEVASSRGVVHYDGVTPAIATNAAWLLRQEIRT